MVVYWGIFLTVIALGFFGKMSEKKTRFKGIVETRPNYYYAFLFFIPIIIFAGFRTRVNDTFVYVAEYKSLPSTLKGIFTYLSYQGKGKGFVFLEILFKTFTHLPYYWFFFFVMLICMLAIFRVYFKYSGDFGLVMYLFVASGCFMWAFTGMRQYLAVCILFSFTDLLFKDNGQKGVKKYINWDMAKYVVVVLIASTIHISAFLMIPVYFLIREEPWELVPTLIIIAMFLVLIFLTLFTNVIENLLEDTAYDDLTEDFSRENGTSIIRVLVNAVPMIISIVFNKRIREIAPKHIKYCVNISIFVTGFYILSVFTNGITIGRLPGWIEMYNCILLAWLINNAFGVKDKSFIYVSALLLYFLFFYYHMIVTGNGSVYVSEFLKITIWD